MPSIDHHGGAPYLDVSGDGYVTPLDLLMVVNYLNNGAPEAESPGTLPDKQSKWADSVTQFYCETSKSP